MRNNVPFSWNAFKKERKLGRRRNGIAVKMKVSSIRRSECFLSLLSLLCIPPATLEIGIAYVFGTVMFSSSFWKPPATANYFFQAKQANLVFCKHSPECEIISNYFESFRIRKQFIIAEIYQSHIGRLIISKSTFRSIQKIIFDLVLVLQTEINFISSSWKVPAPI